MARPRCILHVGPHKTGSTTLQAMLFTLASTLQKDNWHQPSGLPCPPRTEHGQNQCFHDHKNQANLASFLWAPSPNTTEPVWRAFERWVQAAAAKGENIVLSSEGFDRFTVNISLLARVLAPFSVTVVIGYRPFFEWVFSIYRQKSYNIIRQDTHVVDACCRSTHVADRRMLQIKWSSKNPENAANHANTSSRFTLSSWLTPRVATSLGDDNDLLFTNRLVRGYARHFDNIRVLPLGTAMVNTFVCSILTAHLTCDFLRTHPAPMQNVRYAPATTNTSAEACALQGGCLDQEVRTVLLSRTGISAREVALLLRPLLSVNETELGLRFDALGLCFC